MSWQCIRPVHDNRDLEAVLSLTAMDGGLPNATGYVSLPSCWKSHPSDSWLLHWGSFKFSPHRYLGRFLYQPILFQPSWLFPLLGCKWHQCMGWCFRFDSTPSTILVLNLTIKLVLSSTALSCLASLPPVLFSTNWTNLSCLYEWLVKPFFEKTLERGTCNKLISYRLTWPFLYLAPIIYIWLLLNLLR